MGLAHNMVDLAQMARGIGLGVWAAIEFQTAAMALEREPARSRLVVRQNSGWL